VRVPIPRACCARARLDGKLVSLVSGAPGKSGVPLSLVLSKRGRAVVTLDVALPIVSAPAMKVDAALERLGNHSRSGGFPSRK